jgi:hypothetical protein
MTMSYDEMLEAESANPRGWTGARSNREELESYRRRLMDLHAQQQERARTGYDLAGESALLQSAQARSMAAEQGYAAGGVGGLRATAAGTMEATGGGLASAQQERLGAMSSSMDVAAARAGYEQSSAESELKRKGISTAASARISEARRAAEARMMEMKQRILAGSVGAISGGMASGAKYGATSGEGADYGSGGGGGGMYGDGDQPGGYYGS